jgi:small conductance mechanosensitive channel
MLIFVVASTIGIETTSFIAIFSAIAFSVGLALQGSLGNFASGVLILLFKPFKVGDTLRVSGYQGAVSEIQIFSTILRTPSGKKIIIPNGKITEGAIQNIVHGSEVQAELSILISSATSLELLRNTVRQVAANCATALPEKPVDVKIKGLSRDDIKVEVGVWTLGEHFDDTIIYMYEGLRAAFVEAGIELAKERRREQMDA